LKIAKFEDLDCWQESRVLAREIHIITADGLFKKDYGFVDQARRAAISIMAALLSRLF